MSKLLPVITLARTQVFARYVRSEDLGQLDAWLVVIADDTSPKVLERAMVSTTQ